MDAHTKYLKFGAIAWILSLQYYIVQVIVAMRWAYRYSWANNTISDLANTSCNPYGQRFVCSPFHNLMNISFVVLGVTMICGAYMLSQILRRGYNISRIGLYFMAIAGLGTILVGLFPENTNRTLHIFGAALPFIFGNLGMVLIGLGHQYFSKSVKIYTIASGLLGLIALTFFLSHVKLGLGIGGIERIVSYPQSIWMIIFGAYLLIRSRPQTKS